jgi:hypothetical protein
VDDEEKWKSLSTYPHLAKRLGLDQKYSSVLIRPCNLSPTVCSVGLRHICIQYQGSFDVYILLQVGLELLGVSVVINGLVGKPELNGRKGTAVSFDDDKGRYSVEIYGSSTSFMINPCNLSPWVDLLGGSST